MSAYNLKIDSLSVSIQNTFLEILKTSLNKEIHFISNEISEPLTTSTSVKISGAFNGFLYLSFDRKTAKIVAEILWGEENLALLDPKIPDGVKELCNILGGNLSSTLEKDNIDIDLDFTWKFSQLKEDLLKSHYKKYFNYSIDGNTFQVILLLS